MADIATCPKCAKQVGLPATADVTDRVECPECRAVFSLAETVQITLPIAKLLPPEQPVAELPETSTRDEHLVQSAAGPADDQPCEQASETKSSQSWEERLKRALALDGSDDAEPSAAEACGSDVRELAQPAVSPSFEFQLDPPPTVEEPQPANLNLELPEFNPQTIKASAAEEETEPTEAPVKTLADFAASAVKSAADTTAVASTKAINNLVDAGRTGHQTVTRNVAEKSPKSDRRIARRGFPKVAAFVIGPLAGSLLGLYGLLWLQGEQGDHLGLSHILPHSALPASFGQSPDVSGLAESESSDADMLASEPPEEPTEPIIQDGAIKLASATRDVPPPRITASKFVELVEAAEIAMPQFLASTMTSQASIKRKGQAYMAICQLSEHFGFAQQPGLAPSIQEKITVATKFFQDATVDERSRQDLAHIAGQWWRYDKRNNAGIFFTGQVQQVQPTDNGTLFWVQLGDPRATQAIPVWVNNDRFELGQRIGVVGRLLTESNELPPEFTGAQLVRMSHGFAL